MVERSFILALTVILLSCTFNQADKSKAQKESNVSGENDATTESIATGTMIFFEGGSFMMGSDNGTPQENPVHQIEIKSFKIDKYPVTVGEFR